MNLLFMQHNMNYQKQTIVGTEMVETNMKRDRSRKETEEKLSAKYFRRLEAEKSVNERQFSNIFNAESIFK